MFKCVIVLEIISFELTYKWGEQQQLDDGRDGVISAVIVQPEPVSSELAGEKADEEGSPSALLLVPARFGLIRGDPPILALAHFDAEIGEVHAFHCLAVNCELVAIAVLTAVAVRLACD